MAARSRTIRVPIRAVSILSLLLLIASSLAARPGLAAQTVASERDPASAAPLSSIVPAAAPRGTFQDFDQPNTGTPYALGVQVAPAAQMVEGGPTMEGKMLRLASGDPISPTVNANSITFVRTDVGAPNQIVADFDFRITPQTGRADGPSFALLNTATYGTSGAVAPQGPLFAAEEPNFTGSLGIGFDIYRSTHPAPEISDNHISVHFNGALVREFDLRNVLDLGAGEWIHARVVLRPGGGFGDVTVSLTQCGRAPVTVVNQFKIPGLQPYESRAHFAARSGGLTAHHEIDNIHVQPLGLTESLVAFNTGCASIVEADASIHLVVTRAGNVGGAATVNYETGRGTATAADYTGSAGTLRFGAGEREKILSVPIRADTADEGDERFLVMLKDPAGAAVGGPATARVTIIDDEAARRVGHWGDLIPSQVVPIHAHLLPTGQVMYWDRHDQNAGWDGAPRLWHPASDTITRTAMPEPEYDIFCAGHSFLEDGRLLVTGGHIQDLVGEDEASIYDPFTDTWETQPKMNAGRWYPSNVTLSNGDVLVMGGTIMPGDTNKVPQVWQKATNTWRDLSDARHGTYPVDADLYPFLYQAPNGKVFAAGPQPVARYLDTAGTGAWTDVATSTLIYRDYGSSVMYDDGKVLIVGGNERDDTSTIPPSASTEVINLNDAQPRWRTVDPMQFARRHLNTTLLPDGTVLATGGSSVPGFDNPAGAVLNAELWHPETEEWATLAAQTRYRGYHSIALLLPDGRVLVGGGGHPEPIAGAQYNFEIFSPPYLFKGPRPTIDRAPDQVAYNRQFVVTTPNAADIAGVTLIRLSSVTHAFNQNQRISHLSFTRPSNANLAPPGHYMLFLIDKNGVPSVAQIIRLGHTVALDDSYSVSNDAVLRVPAPGILSNDVDVNGKNLTAQLTTGPKHGELNLSSNGSFTYQPDAGYIGPDSFTYTASNDQLKTEPAIVHIMINDRGYLPLIRR
jgi:hypothetical protein